jgi:integrase
VALSLGLRQGEALGLRWEDVEFDVRTLRVSMALQSIGGKLVLVPPKTATSRRTLPLPAVLVPVLNAHHARQLEDRLESRWQDYGLIFCTRTGTPIGARNLIRAF